MVEVVELHGEGISANDDGIGDTAGCDVTVAGPAGGPDDDAVVVGVIFKGVDGDGNRRNRQWGNGPGNRDGDGTWRFISPLAVIHVFELSGGGVRDCVDTVCLVAKGVVSNVGGVDNTVLEAAVVDEVWISGRATNGVLRDGEGDLLRAGGAVRPFAVIKAGEIVERGGGSVNASIGGGGVTQLVVVRGLRRNAALLGTVVDEARNGGWLVGG